jgi:hypothetical protein
MNAFLESRFKQIDHTQWKIGAYDLEHAFAVAAGTKPAAIVEITGENPEYAPYELADFLKSKGAKVVYHNVPTARVTLDDSGVAHPSVAINYSLFVYRDEPVLERYKSIIQASAKGEISDDQRNRALGEMLGYDRAAINAHIANTVKSAPLPGGDKWDKMPLVEFLQAHAYGAVYDDLREDPILGSALPPRKAPQRPLG